MPGETVFIARALASVASLDASNHIAREVSVCVTEMLWVQELPTGV